jgi:AcrR family transcriptional regulator
MPRAAPYDRDAALDAALTLFWEKGFHATSLKDLEGALEMKPGSIYAAFTSKERLYLLALERYFERSRMAFQDHVRHAASPLAALSSHFRAFAQLGPQDGGRRACMLTKTLVDTRATDPAIVAATRKYLAAMQIAFADVFSEAKSAGEIDPASDPDRLARRFQANLTALRLSADQGLGTDAFVDLAEDMALELDALLMR